MNPSERLHNQGNEEQVITPELKLSMQLRDTCEELLQKKGGNEFNYPELLSRSILGFVIIRSLATRTMPQVQSITSRIVKLKGERSDEPDVFIACNSTNPSKAKWVDVWIQNNKFMRLRLGKNQEGVIMRKLQSANPRFLDTPTTTEVEPATTEDLSYYQDLISQSLPIEHK